VFSEYKTEYKPYDQYGKAKDCRPEHKPVRGDAPMDGLTTHRVDYIPHPLEKPYVHQGEQYKAPDGSMDNLTNYRIDYERKALDPVKPLKREEAKRVAARFEGEPTYKTDYRKWEVHPITKKGSEYIYKPSEDAFNGQTNYKSDYIPHNTARTESIRPAYQPLASDVPFDSNTHYRLEYIPHELQKREKKEREQWQPNDARIDDLTNYRRDYVPREITKTNSYKPNNKPLESEAKFADETTHKTDYRTLPLEKRYQHERETYRQPEGSMESQTTHKTDYTPKPLERTSAIRPLESKRVSASFDSTTQYKTDYRSHGAVDRPAPIIRERYNPTDAPFEGQPTYRRDYVQYDGAQPPKSLKPTEGGVSSGVPLDSDTEYKKEYTFKFLPPCPSDAIMAGRTDTGYTFKETDELGHRWYEVATRA
jgi:hypothetical protein